MPRGYPVVNQEPLDRLVDLLFQMHPFELRAAVALVKGFSRNRPAPKAEDDERQQSLEGVKDGGI